MEWRVRTRCTSFDDVYPWFLGRQMDETIVAFTPAVGGFHEVFPFTASVGGRLGRTLP